MPPILHHLRLRWIRSPASLVLASLGLAAFVAALALVSPPKPQLDFLLDVTVLRGGQPGLAVRLSLDDARDGTASRPLSTSGRQVIGCSLQTLEANTIRLAPASQQGVEIAIHGLEVQTRGVRIIHLAPAQLAQAKLENLDILRLEPEALVVTTRSPEALAMLSVPHLSPLPQSVLPLVRFIVADAMRPFVLSLLFCGTLSILLCAGLGAGGWRLLFGTACGAVLAVAAVWGIKSQSFWALPDVGAAVGFSAYVGSSKQADILCMLAGGLLPVCMGIAGILSMRSPCTAKIQTGSAPRASRYYQPTMSQHFFLLIVVIIGLFFLCVPDLKWEYDQLPSRLFPNQWDEYNVLTWRYMVQIGDRPFVDFWFPYGGLFLYYLPFPFGSLFIQGHVYLQWVLLLLTCYYAGGHRFWSAFAVLSIMFGFVEMSTLFAIPRYTLPIGNVCLAFAGVDTKKNWVQPPHFLFWIAVLFAACFDPPVLLYACTPVGALILARQATQERLCLRDFIINVLRLFLVPALCVFALLGLLAATGTLTGVASFYLHLDELAAYASIPVPAKSWLHFKPVPEGMDFWLTGLLTGLGLFSFFTSSTEERKLGGLIFMLGLGSGMMHLKQGIRPSIVWQIMPLLFLAVLVMLIFGLRRMKGLQRGIALTILAILVLLFSHSHGVRTIAGRAVYGCKTLPGSVAVLRQTWGRQRELTEQDFALHKFQDLTEQMQVVDALKTNDFGSAEQLFILGDEPNLYIMSRRSPLFIINLYDGSPLRLQRDTAEALLRDRPPVVWPGQPIGMDNIPLAVRTPILVNTVVANYVPATTYGHHSVLRPRKKGEAIHLGFWRRALGTSINLGHLPCIVNAWRFPVAPQVRGQTAHFLRVYLDSPVSAAESKVIPVSVGGKRYDILFVAVPGREKYTIFLDRIWFYGPTREAGLHPVVEPMPGLHYEFIERGGGLSRLY